MRPSRKMRQGGCDKVSSSSDTRPRNTARICLDGTSGRETVSSFQEGISSIFTWCRTNGIAQDVSSLFGPGVEVVTSPTRGTFHLELEYEERLLESVINGRDLYLMGWRGPNGSFEIREKSTKKKSDQRNYMVGKDVRPVYMGKNYADLAPNRILGDTKLGIYKFRIYKFRRAFDALYEYKGGSPGTIKEAVGRLAVFICEATRFPFVEDIVCRSFTDISVSRLKQVETETETDLLWLQRWDHCSGMLMEHIDCALANRTPPAIVPRGLKIQSAADIVPMIRVLHIDAYNKGKFAHDRLPKVMFEEPIEQMKGSLERNKKGKQSQSKGGKRNKKQLKEQSVGKVSRSAHHRYSTSSVCSSPSLCVEENSTSCKSVCPSASLDIWQRHCVVENNSSRKSLKRGCGGSELRHLGEARVPSSDSWRQCVEQNRSACKFFKSLGRGYGRTTLIHLGQQASDSMHFPALQKLCGLSYEMRRRWKTKRPIYRFSSTTAARAQQHGDQPLMTNFLPSVWRKRKLLKKGSGKSRHCLIK